jgi:hypothetical protein
MPDKGKRTVPHQGVGKRRRNGAAAQSPNRPNDQDCPKDDQQPAQDDQPGKLRKDTLCRYCGGEQKGYT